MGGSIGRLRAALAEPENEEVLRSAFACYDTDKNGLLDHEELLRFANDVRSLVKKTRDPLEAEAVEMHSERAFVTQLLAAVEGEAKFCSFDAFVRFVRAHPRGTVPLISLAKNELLCEWEGRPFVCGSLTSIFDYQWKAKLRDAAAAAFGEDKIPPPEEIEFWLNDTKRMLTMDWMDLYKNGCLWTGDDDFIVTLQDARARPAGEVLVKSVEEGRLVCFRTPLLQYGDTIGALRQRIVAQRQLGAHKVSMLFRGKFLDDDELLIDTLCLIDGDEISLMIDKKL